MNHPQVGAVPIRDPHSKWYVHFKQFNESRYPNYCSGTAYAMTLSAAREIKAVIPETPFFWLEDIYITGLCVRKTQGKVTVVDDGRFTYNKPRASGDQFDNMVSGHRYSIGEIRRIHKQRGNKCSVS